MADTLITIASIIESKNLAPEKPVKQPIYFAEDEFGNDLPYRFAKNGTEEAVEYWDFGPEIISLIKFLPPTGDFYKALSHPEAFQDCDPMTRKADAKAFGFEWAAMFEQLNNTCADIKDNGGLTVYPNITYLRKCLDDIKCKRKPVTTVRREFQKIIRSCIAHNYAEVERLNKNLDESSQIKLSESKSFMKSIAIEEGTIKTDKRYK